MQLIAGFGSRQAFFVVQAHATPNAREKYLRYVVVARVLRVRSLGNGRHNAVSVACALVALTTIREQPMLYLRAFCLRVRPVCSRLSLPHVWPPSRKAVFPLLHQMAGRGAGAMSSTTIVMACDDGGDDSDVAQRTSLNLSRPSASRLQIWLAEIPSSEGGQTGTAGGLGRRKSCGSSLQGPGGRQTEEIDERAPLQHELPADCSIRVVGFGAYAQTSSRCTCTARKALRCW